MVRGERKSGLRFNREVVRGGPWRRRRQAAEIALVTAKVRLDTLDFYPRPVSLRGVRIHVWPWFFRLPGLCGFDGYAAVLGQIILREPLAHTSGDLVCHELCHVWQMQHLPLRMPLSYLRTGYANNPFEREARKAVALTLSVR